MVSLIYGSGGHARELAFQMQADGNEIVAFVDDLADSPTPINGIPVLRRDAALADHRFATWLVAIGRPEVRARMTEELRKAGARFRSFVSSRALVAPTTIVREGAQIFANAVVSDRVVIGDGVIVHYGSVIAHDSEVGEFSIICPGATLCGYVWIGDRVWVGAGATIKNGGPGSLLIVEPRAIVGAGATVVSNVARGSTVVGVPARPARHPEPTPLTLVT